MLFNADFSVGEGGCTMILGTTVFGIFGQGLPLSLLGSLCVLSALFLVFCSGIGETSTKEN